MQETTSAGLDLVDIAGSLAAAYVRRNVVPAKEMPDLIRSVHAALALLMNPESEESADQPDVKPTATEIRRSITHDGLTSFIDGKSYKTLKRHLRVHGLDPYSYRQRYGLPSDYPMVAASYSEMRSALSKAAGLGRKGA